MDETILKAIRQRAFGFENREVTEEYAIVDGEETLVRRKIKTTAVPPDLTAIKMLTDLEPKDELSYDELLHEKERLLREWLQDKGGK